MINSFCSVKLHLNLPGNRRRRT